MEDLKLELLRINLQKTYTEGVLFNVNTNTKIFDTLEDKVRDADGSGKFEKKKGEVKVYGETAIPYTAIGEVYELEVTYSPKFKMYMVLVKNVPDFTGIRCHWGRTALQTLGCILGGEKVADGELKNTGFTKYMVDLLNQYGGKATLTIT